MEYILLAIFFTIIALLPHLKIDSIYKLLTEIAKNTVPILLLEIEKAVNKAGLSKKWERYMLLWFFLSFPIALLYFIISLKYFTISLFWYILISFSPFIGYFILLAGGSRRSNLIKNDVRQVYRALKLVIRAGGTGEEGLKKSLKYTTILQKSLEGVLINWGEAEYQLLKLRQRYKVIEVENLVAYLLEIKKGVSKELLDNIERQEQQLAMAHAREIARANKRDDDIAQISFALLLIAQFYLVAMPLLNENIRTFQAF